MPDSPHESTAVTVGGAADASVRGGRPAWAVRGAVTSGRALHYKVPADQVADHAGDGRPGQSGQPDQV